MFKKGEICIVNESGANYFNIYSRDAGGIEIKAGDKVVCRETDSNPYCTPLTYFRKGDGVYTVENAGDCMSTWALSEYRMQSTGEFMELD